MQLFPRPFSRATCTIDLAEARAAVRIPLYHEPMKIGYSAKLAPIKAHNIYGCGLYKGLDLKFASK